MADIDRIATQVTQLLGAGEKVSTGAPIYNRNVADFARSPMEIEASCINGALMAAQAVCESASSPFRTPFLEVADLEHGQPLPFHYGDTSVPEITPFDGATFTLRGVRKSYDKIEAYRINANNIYSPVAHDQPNAGKASPIAGFYDIVNGIFYFSGCEATMFLANFTRDTAVGLLADALEPVVIKLALGVSAKDGDTSDGLFQAWYAQGMQDLAGIRSGATAFQPVDTFLAARGDQTA